MDAQELYCKIYANTTQDRPWLLQQVAQQCHGTIAGRTVEASELIVDVSRNEDYDPVRANESDGFVYFAYYMDVVPADGVARDAYVGMVRKLIVGLRQNDVKVVAACDFENELTP